MQEKSQRLDQEISLRQYMRFIIKQKKVVFSIFSISMIISAVITYVMPKSCEISVVIKPPVFEYGGPNNAIFADLPYGLNAKIEEGAFNLGIVKALKLNLKKDGIKLITSNLSDSKYLKIAIKEPKDKEGLGIKILDQLFNEIAEFYNGPLEDQRKDIDGLIANAPEKIRRIHNDMEPNKQSIYTKNNKRGSSNILVIDGFQEALKKELERLKNLRANISNIKLVQEPRISYAPASPNMMKNIFFAGILGLAMGPLAVFFMEFRKLPGFDESLIRN